MLGLVAVISVASACSSTPDLPGLGGNESAAFCKAARQLPEVASEFVDVPTDDPETFEPALREAVDAYIADLDAVAARAPGELDKHLSTLRSAVDQYKFADGLDAKEPIDVYVAEHCPAVTTSSTTAG